MSEIQNISVAKIEIANAINMIGNKHELSGCILELIISECLSEIRNASKTELVLSYMKEEQEDVNTESQD